MLPLLRGRCGTVFKLTRKNSQWIFSTLYTFQGGLDGISPSARVVFGPDGALYGTTANGGEVGCPVRGCGTVFSLRPPPSACNTALCPWTETVLHRFNYSSHGYWPGNGALLIAPSGVIYGTVTSGGTYGAGAVFSLTPSQGGWTYSVIYSFTGGNDGAVPQSGLIFDNALNLYGTAPGGGFYGYGTVYELVPSGSGWQEKTLWAFTGTRQDGYAVYPVGGLIFDGSGNLYGTTATNNFQPGGGTAFELSPSLAGWTITSMAGVGNGMISAGPVDSLAMDAGGNLYGTCPQDDDDYAGAIFKWLPNQTFTWLYAWAGEGDIPYGGPILDASGNVYGTISGGSDYGYGTVWEITP